MKALVLAAGLGKRMRPLTYECPKPLLKVGSWRLIDWSIAGLVSAGIREIVINAAHLSNQFEPALGNQRFGARIHYSIEGPSWNESLETLGGIAKALPLLSNGSEPFIVVAGDIVSNFDFSHLVVQREAILRGEKDAHLVLVPNPEFHPSGDMSLDGIWVSRKETSYTFSSIGIYSPRIFQGVRPVYQKLFPWFYQFVDNKRVSGELFEGFWENVGTPQALESLSDRCRLGKVPIPYLR